MPLRVGAAVGEFRLEYPGVKEASAAIQQHLREAQTASTRAANAFEKNNERILASFRKLQSDVQGLRPFASLVDDAQRAYQTVVGGSIIPDLRKGVVSEIQQLRQTLAQLRPFGAIETGAAQAAAAAEARIRELKDEAAGLKAAFANIGFPAEALRASEAGVVDAEGRIREALEVPPEQASLDERQNPRRQGSFNRVRSTTALERRLEDFQANAPATSALGRAGSIQEMKDLAAEAARLQASLDAVDRELASLNAEAPTKGLAALGSAFVEAEAAERSFTQSSERTIAVQKELEAALLRREQAERRFSGALSSLEGREEDVGAIQEAETAERGLEDAIEGERLAHEAATKAAREHEEAIDRVATANRDAQRFLQETPTRARPGGTSEAQRQTEIAERQQVAAAERQIEHERQLARLQVQREAEVAAVRERNAGQLATAEEQATAQKFAAEQDRIARQYKADQERIARTAVEEQKGINRIKEMQAKASADILRRQTEDVTKLTAARIAGEAKAEAARESARIREEARDRRQAEKLAAGGVFGGRAPLDAEGQEFQQKLDIAKADKDRAEALRLVQAEMARVGETSTRHHALLKEETRLKRQLRDEDDRMRRGAGGLRAFGQELLDVTGYGSAAIGVFFGATRAIRELREAFNLSAQIDLTRRSLGAMIDDTGRANRAFVEGRQFGREYGFTMQEIAEVSQSLAPVMRQSTVELEKQFEITARLLSRQPAQGFQGAAFAIGELQAGDTQSIRERFNIPITLAARMREEVKSGADAFEVLDRALLQLGVDSDALRERMEGAAGATLRWKLATSDLRLSVGDLATQAAPAIAFVARFIQLGADSIRTAALLKRLFTEPAEAAKDLFNILAGQDTIKTLFEAFTGIDLSGIKPIAPEVNESFERLIILNNRLNSGTTGLRTYREELGQLGAGLDTEGIVRSTANVQDLDAKAAVLTRHFNDLKQAAEQDPALQEKYLPQLIAIARELANIQAKSPIEISIEVRTQRLQEARGIIDEVIGRAKQASKEIDDSAARLDERSGELADQLLKAQEDLEEANRKAEGQQRKTLARAESDFLQVNDPTTGRAFRDFARSTARADRDFNAQWDELTGRAARDLARTQERAARDFDRQWNEITGRAARDFNRTMARGDRDFNQQWDVVTGRATRDATRQISRLGRDAQRADEKARADHAQKLVDIDRELAKDLLEIEQDTNRRLTDERADFQRSELETEQDYLDERAGLYAQGKIAEAIVLEYRFRRDARRRAEEQARRESEITTEGGERADEARTGADEARAEAQTDLDRGIAERREQLELQRQDIREQLALQRQDAIDARNQQKIDAQVDFERARADALESHQQQAADAREQLRLQREDAIAARNQQKLDAAADFALMIADNKAAYEQQVADIKQSYADQKEERDAAFRQTREDLDAQFTAEEAKHHTHVEKIKADFAAYLEDVQTKVEDAGKARIRAEQLVAEGVEPAIAQEIALMEQSLLTFAEVTDKKLPLMYDSGFKAGQEFLRGHADALLGQARPQPTGGIGTGTIDTPDRRGTSGSTQPLQPPNALNPLQQQILDRNPANDPRPDTATVQALFGPSARITSTYDNTRPVGQGVTQPGFLDAHGGLDITMDKGARVPAPFDMQILTVSSDQFAGGTTVKALDRQGHQWLFAHLHGVEGLTPGQWLARGKTLGYIGEEGHVHVQERRRNDASIPIDPTADLNRAAGVTGSSTGAISPFSARSTSGISPYRAGAQGLPTGTLGTVPSLSPAAGAPGGAGPGGTSVMQPIIITGEVKMDGQTVATLVAPTVELIITDGVVSSFRTASSSPSLQQGSFRTPA